MKRETVWWQTLLALVVAALLFFALVYLTGAIFLLQSWMMGDKGVAWISRGLQAALSAAGAIYFSKLLLKRANYTVLACVFAAVMLIPALVGVGVETFEGSGPRGLFGWLEVIATYGGLALGVLIAHSKDPVGSFG